MSAGWQVGFWQEPGMQLFFVASREHTQMPEWTFELRRGWVGLTSFCGRKGLIRTSSIPPSPYVEG